MISVFFVIFFIVADSQADIAENRENSDVNISSSALENSRKPLSSALDIQSILHSLNKIGFGLRVGFGKVDTYHSLISKRKQAMGMNLVMYFTDCNGDVTTDNLLIETLRSLFNGNSSVYFSADYGDFFRDLGLSNLPKNLTEPRMNKLPLCEVSINGTLAGGGIGLAHSFAGQAYGSYTLARGGAFGIGLGHTRAVGKGPNINFLTSHLQRFVRNPILI